MDQSKFIENGQYGKQIDDFLDMPKRPKTSTGPKTHFLWLEYEKSGNQVPILENEFIFVFEKVEKSEHNQKMLTENLCIMAVILFQTSSRGSGLKQNRFGRKFRNTVKCSHKLNVALTF